MCVEHNLKTLSENTNLNDGVSKIYMHLFALVLNIMKQWMFVVKTFKKHDNENIVYLNVPISITCIIQD